MKQYILHGTVPAKKNSRINTRSGRSFPSRRYTEWHEQASLEILAQGIQQFARVRITVEFQFRTNRRTDLDNKLSSILDLFQDLGILEDDRWQIVPEVVMTASLGKEDITLITLEELGENHI